MRNTGKQRRLNEGDTDYDYSDLVTSRRLYRQDYKMGSHRYPWERRYSEYSYSTPYNRDRYHDWKDIYRSDYSRDKYNFYDSLYDSSDDNDTYRYRSRSRYNNYDDTEYSSYYDEYDTDYTVKKSNSECSTCNKHSRRRHSRTGDSTSNYTYRYEEDHPKGYTQSDSYKRNKKAVVSRETDQAQYRNAMNIYAVHNISGQKSFQYKNYKAPESVTSEILSETEVDLIHQGYFKKKRKPEYNIYTTHTRNNITSFDKNFKKKSPERLVSVTDYQDTHRPILAFKNKKNKESSFNGGSDFIYLPIVMKEKDKKIVYNINNKKYSKLKRIPGTAEKPLEDNISVYTAMDSRKYNIFQYKNRSEQNLSHLRGYKKDIPVYTATRGGSQIFSKAADDATNTRMQSNTSIRSRNYSEPNPETGPSTFNTSNEITSFENIPTTPGGENYKRSTAKPSKAYDMLDTDMEEQDIQKSDFRQSYTSQRGPSVVNKRKSLAGEQKIGKTPLKSIIKQSATADQYGGVTNKSYVGVPPDFRQNLHYLPDANSGFEEEEQNLQGNLSQEHTAAPKRYARKSNVIARKKSSEKVSRPSNIMLKSLLRRPKQSSLRQSSVAQPSQSFIDSATVAGMDKGNVQGREKRQSTVPQRNKSLIELSLIDTNQVNETGKDSLPRKSSAVQRDQSFNDMDQVMGTELRQTKESQARLSSANKKGQSFVGRNQVTGSKDRTQKSVLSQSNLPQKGQSFVNVADQMGETERKSTNKSLVRQSKKEQSLVARDQVKGIEEPNIQTSMVGQSYVRHKPQSFVDIDQLMGMEGQNTKKRLGRPNSGDQRSQSYVDNQKSVMRQSNVAKGQSLAVRGQNLTTEGQSFQKSITRRSHVDPKGQSVVGRDQLTGGAEENTQSNVKQSIVTGRGQSLVGTDKKIENEEQTLKKRTGRQSTIAQRGSSTVGNKPKLSTVSKTGARQSIASRQQSLTRKEQGEPEIFSQGTMKSNASVKITKPAKAKSKTIFKRAFTKLGAFSRRPGQLDKDRGSTSTVPVLDEIMSEHFMEPQTTKVGLPPERFEAISAGSSESVGQQALKPKKSTKSKISGTFKSLLKKSKKSDLTKQRPNIGDVQSTHQSFIYADKKPREQYPGSVSPISEDTYDQTDGDMISTESSKHTYISANKLSTVFKGYDLTYVLLFLHFAKFIVGVTIHDKLMEVFTVIYK